MSHEHTQDSHAHVEFDVWCVEEADTPGFYREINRCKSCGAIFSYPKPLPIPDGMPTYPPEEAP